ncbi:MAG: hypothetical protein WDN69_28380 [Aliidongia sp.]
MIRPSTDPDTARAATLAAELRTLLGRLKRRLREQAPPGDLTWPHLSVLGHLDRDGPATVTALARVEACARNPWAPSSRHSKRLGTSPASRIRPMVGRRSLP